jgi:tetratricopeptide (TPR) repeat protein
MKTLLLVLSVFFALGASAQDAKTLYEEGVALKTQRKIPEAKAKFEQALKIKPNDDAIIYELGWVANDRGDYKRALQYFNSISKAWRTVPKLFFEMGFAYNKLSQRDSALYCYNKTLELKPDYSGAYKQLGYLAYDKDDHENALAKFASYEQYEKNPITDYLFWFRKGFCSNALKKYADAKTALLKSLEIKKDYISTYHELGFSATNLKEGNDAINYFKKAMAIDAKSHISYNGIGEVYRDVVKNIDSALYWYQKALVVKPNERKACFGVAYCFNSQGKYNEAIPYLQKAIEQEPGYIAAYVEYGYSLRKIGKIEEALVQFDKALAINPKNANALYYKGSIYVDQKNKDKAQQMVNELKQMNHKNAELLQKLVGGMSN